MRNRVDPDSMGFLVTDVARLIRAEMDRRIAEAGLGLTPGEGRTLVHIARAGAVRQTDLAERMGVEAMTVTGYLDRLEAKGMVDRQADPADRRAKRVHLTQAADKLLEKIVPLSAGLRTDASVGVSGEDWSRFLETLRTVRENLTVARTQGAAA